MNNKRLTRFRPGPASLAFALSSSLLAFIAGCGGGSSGGGGPGPGPGPGPGAPDLASQFYVSNNGMSNAGDVDQFNSNFMRQKTFDAGNNEGVVLDIAGTLYQAGDTASPGSIRVINVIRGRMDGGAFDDTALDREITGGGALAAPKGIAIAHAQGYLFVADNGDSSIDVLATTSGSTAALLDTVTLGAAPWDVAYDEANDRLFVALTDGTIAVFDTFVADGFGDSGAARIITPMVAPAATNIHGIAYNADTDQLVVSDVGDGAVLTGDGSIYVIDNASMANGPVAPSRTIRGAATQLGNPVDLILIDGDARVAEKGANQLLVFQDIFTPRASDPNTAPDLAVAETAPESLVAEIVNAGTGQPPGNPDVTDIDDPATTIAAISVTSNPAGGPSGPITQLDPDLTTVLATFTSTNPNIGLENITFNQAGDGYVTRAASGSQPVLQFYNRLAAGRDGEAADAGDRQTMASVTGLVAPKGLDVADSLGLALTADNGDNVTGSVAVFGANADNAGPVYPPTSLSVAPWDLDYDPVNDRLYVALINGTVAVFDDYVANQGANPANRTITPMVDGTPSTNLHSVIHVAASDDLIVSDVGSGAVTTDGKIYVIPNASTADGMTAVSVEIDNGDDGTLGNTMLGNPVDIAFDCENLYVAEKSNNLVLRFDGILDSMGGDVAPSAMFTVTAPESVALAPDYLSTAPPSSTASP